MKNPDISSKNSSFKQEPLKSEIFGDASSISRSRKEKYEGDSNRIPTEEDPLDDEVNFREEILSISSANKLKSPLIPEEKVDFIDLPLDKSLENTGNNNEFIIKDEKAYKRDLNISTIGNIVLEELISEFQQEIMDSEVLFMKFVGFQRIVELPAYKSINTTIYAVDEYLNILNNFVRERFGNDFLENINQPWDKDVLQKLRIYNEVKFESSVKEFTIKPDDVLPTELYLELEDILLVLLIFLLLSFSIFCKFFLNSSLIFQIFHHNNPSFH